MAHLIKRGVSAHTRGIILGSVFGILGGVFFIVAMFYLARWFMYREAMAADMVIEPPLSPTQEQGREEKPNMSYPIQQDPQHQPPPRRMNTPDPGTYMHNHPYAVPYARRDSYPPDHPYAPEQRHQTPVPPLPPLIVSHPYSQHPQEEQSATTPHESVPDTPEPTVRAPSPLASTVGGVTGYYSGPLSAMSSDAPSTFSQPNSTTPLRME